MKIENIIINPFNRYESLLLEIPSNQVDKYNHLLRLRDRESVQDVLSYLQKNKLNIFLAGGVVKNYLKKGKGKSYDDIDILGTGNIENLRVIADNLIKANNKEKFLDTNNEFNIVCENSSKLRKIYLGFDYDERFKLKPTGLNKLMGVKSIDLILISKPKFDGGLK